MTVWFIELFLCWTHHFDQEAALQQIYPTPTLLVSVIHFMFRYFCKNVELISISRLEVIHWISLYLHRCIYVCVYVS